MNVQAGAMLMPFSMLLLHSKSIRVLSLVCVMLQFVDNERLHVLEEELRSLRLMA